jgi:uncharacterized membrane protein YkvA (DUF1232 family)
MDEDVTKNESARDTDGKLTEDYQTARKALEQLWDTLAKETHTKFSGVADEVEHRFRDTRERIKETDVKEALGKAGTTIEKLAKSASKQAQKLAKQAKLLYSMLKDSVSGKFKAPWPTIAALAATLLYLVNPIDVIPDFIPGLGFIDDALVVALCISIVRIDLRRYADENGLKLEDYGL